MKKTLALVLTFAMLLTLLVVPASAATTNRLVISDCDTLTGWTKTGGGALIVRTDGLNSANSVASTVNYGAFRTATFAPQAAMDLSDYTYLEWDVRFHTTANNGREGTMWEQILAAYVDNGKNEMYLKISSTGTNKCNIFRKSTMTITVVDSDWVHFKVKMDQPNTARDFDPSAFTGFYFSTTDSSTVDNTVDNGFVAIDNIVATNDAAVNPEPDPGSSSTTSTKLLCDCSTTDGWTKTGGNALNVNAGGYNSGFDTNSAIGCGVNYGAFRTATYTLPESVDLTDYKYLEWDVRFHTTTTHGGVGSMWDQIQLKYGTSGNNTLLLKLSSSDNDYDVFFLSKMNAVVSSTDPEWVHFQVEIGDANSHKGSFDKTSLKKFYFATVDGAVDTTVDDGVIRIDNIMAVPAPASTGGSTGPEVTTVITNCDSATGWSNVGGNPFVTATASSSGAGTPPSDTFLWNGINNGAFRAHTYTLTTPMDISSCASVKWDFFAGAAGLWEAASVAYENAIYVQLGSSGGGTRTFKLDKLVVSSSSAAWYKMAVNLDTFTQDNGFNPSALTTFTIAVCPQGTTINSDVANGFMGIDNLCASTKKQTVVVSGPQKWNLIDSPNEKTITSANYVCSNTFSYDLSAYTKSTLWLVAKIYIENKTNPGQTGNLLSGGQLELTSSGGSDVNEANWSLGKLNLHDGWNNLYLALDSASNDNGLSLSDVNYMRFYLNPVSGNTDVYTVRVEQMYLTNEKEKAVMPSFFADNMMFQQNKTMNLWGVGGTGSTVRVELYKANTLVSSANTTVDTDGNWEVKLPARAGSYDNYSIKVLMDGTVVKEIGNILIGELWLASGQSNMEYFLGTSFEATNLAGRMAEFTSKNLADQYIRVMMEPSVPGGTNSTIAATPYYDVEPDTSASSAQMREVHWTDGSTFTNVIYSSAVAYYTALELRKTLNVPVGFLNVSRGSSVIETWMSRESIENNATVKSILQKKGLYRTEQQMAVAGNWNSMTALYNSKLAPLGGMNIAGVLWYQGESNIKYADTNGTNSFYEAALKQMAEDWGVLFNFNAGDMPFVFAHIAPYNYNNVRANDFDVTIPMLSEAMSKACAAHPNSMVQIPIYDQSLEYCSDNFPIHPRTKEPVGKNFAAAILSKFYNQGTPGFAAATFKSMTVVGNKIRVKFDNVGSGLSLRDVNSDLEGFTICGSDRVFGNAYAQIIANDTVEVYSPLINNPVAVAYAFSSFNMNANLKNSFGLPVVPFRSDEVASVHVGDNDWMNADHSTIWIADNTSAGANCKGESVATWDKKSGTATVTFDTGVKAQGNSSVKVVSSSGTAAVGPVLGLKTMLANKLGNYRYLSVKVKNDDNTAKTFSLNISNSSYFVCTTDGATTVTLPANSGFTTYTFDLTNLKTTAAGTTAVSAANALTAVNSNVLKFTVNTAGTIHLDDIRLGTAIATEILSVKATLGQTISQFLSANGFASSVTVYRGNTALAAGAAIGTGDYASNGTKTVYAIVYGDLDGDGVRGATDLVRFRQHLLGNNSLQGYFFEAAKRNDNESSLDVRGLVHMKRVMSGYAS
ncbi:MAG: hypothetical protein IKI29_03960 [Clostridia bacterium]|nr:hypothetical protein [Clostridia bacterium]